MTELITWLRAVLDERERVARAATAGPWWHNPGKVWLGAEAFEAYDRSKGEEFVGYGESPLSGCVAATGPASHAQSMADAAHIALNDPVAVLTEVAADRLILANYERALDRRKDHPDDLASAGALLAMLHVIKLLCLRYAQHEGYRDEWRP